MKKLIIILFLLFPSSAIAQMGKRLPQCGYGTEVLLQVSEGEEPGKIAFAVTTQDSESWRAMVTPVMLHSQYNEARYKLYYWKDNEKWFAHEYKTRQTPIANSAFGGAKPGFNGASETEPNTPVANITEYPVSPGNYEADVIAELPMEYSIGFNEQPFGEYVRCDQSNFVWNITIK